MGAALEVTTNQRECNNVTVLSWEFKTHVELVFKHFAVKAGQQNKITDSRKFNEE